MLVVCGNTEQIYGFKFSGLDRFTISDPNAFECYEPGWSWTKAFYAGEVRPSVRLLIPMESRTMASPTGQSDYVFDRQGGLS
mgnify:CR=1 FL=1